MGFRGSPLYLTFFAPARQSELLHNEEIVIYTVLRNEAGGGRLDQRKLKFHAHVIFAPKFMI